MASRSIAVLALPGVQLLDVAGPLDVFAEANAQSGRDAYGLALDRDGARPDHDVVGTAPDRRPRRARQPELRASTRCWSPVRRGSTRRRSGPISCAWLADAAARCRRYGSVCSGAFLLGQAGLLDGRRVTTHWAVAEMLAARYPEARVEPDAICLFDGPLRTAAGVTAGLDLALALVEEDLGAEIARRVAAQLVMFFKRGGGQMQFSRRGVSAPDRPLGPPGGAALGRRPSGGGSRRRRGSPTAPG